MEVKFREVDPFNCWIWLEFSSVPTQGEKNYLNGIFDSWYVIGRLGGFNAENLQAHQEGVELSWLNYENNELENTMPSLMHNLGNMEYQGSWSRCWVDFGTSDALAIDVLINTINQINGELIDIKEVRIGGVNEDWLVEDHPDSIFNSSN